MTRESIAIDSVLFHLFIRQFCDISDVIIFAAISPQLRFTAFPCLEREGQKSDIACKGPLPLSLHSFISLSSFCDTSDVIIFATISLHIACKGL